MRDDAVAGVVGEMLMLCIVIILAAVLSSNVSSLMPEFEDVPYATFIGKISGQNISIMHEGGEAIPLNKLRIIIDNGTIISCTFNASNLLCENMLNGKLDDVNRNNCWDFGEILEIYKNGERMKITIAHKRQILCKIFIGW